jgi:hypothetical protein
LKPLRFSPDQLILILVVGLVIVATAVWRYFTMY